MTVDRKPRVLFVAYPLLPVSPMSCGGAEQMLIALEAELHRRGYRTAVAACDGSQVAGTLLPTGPPVRPGEDFGPREAAHAERVLAALDSGAFDLVHDESGLFWKHAARCKKPVLATLHLPLDFYGGEALANAAANVRFSCVSQSQRARFAGHLPSAQFLGVVQNGIRVADFAPHPCKQNYLLWLGRICPEKGVHTAIEVAKEAGLPLVIAGQVYPFPSHLAYFEQRVIPHMGEQVRFVESPPLEHKRQLLADAKAVVIPSEVEETSSLVAMEAAASATPVVAFAAGALPEIVRHGLTGFVVSSKSAMASAIQDISQIAPPLCRQYAEEHFSAARMADEYEALYSEILGREAAAGTSAA